MDMKQKRNLWAVLFTVCTVLAVLWLARLSAPGVERTSDYDIRADQLHADGRTASDRVLSQPRKNNKSGTPFESSNGVENPPKDNARLNSDARGQASEQESELAYIERLRWLAVDEPDRALALAEQGEESFPYGEFSEERQAIAINVLVRLDRIGEARSRTRAFIRRYPKGRFTRQVRGLTGVHPRPAGPNREWEW
jgi:hypothetical protein